MERSMKTRAKTFGRVLALLLVAGASYAIGVAQSKENFDEGHASVDGVRLR
jgi:hypothetical protein